MNRSSLETLPKLGLLGSLYFSQGLPFGFFSQALPVLLRKDGYSLGAIGLSSWLALPWALKFLWAPLVDRRQGGALGPRRSWILPLQLALVTTLLLLAGLTSQAGPSHGRTLELLILGVFFLNLIAATQDIATDGLAVDCLKPGERGLANGLQVAGYRVGMIVGGGALLILHEQLGSSGVFLVMAGLTALASLPIAFANEPRTPSAGHPRRASILHFLRKPDAARIVLVLLVFKAGDAFASSMLRPFLVDAGLGLTELGWLLGTVGFVAGLVGALLGGALVNVLGRRRALVVFGSLQALSVAGYAWLALSTPSLGELYVLSAFEHLAGGMATAALFTCMMDWCSPDESATDYTVQASLVVIASGAAAAIAGPSAQSLGYFAHFCLAAGLCLVAVLVVRFGFPKAGSLDRLPVSSREAASCA